MANGHVWFFEDLFFRGPLIGPGVPDDPVSPEIPSFVSRKPLPIPVAPFIHRISVHS
jgi:hypothetical protein